MEKHELAIVIVSLFFRFYLRLIPTVTKCSCVLVRERNRATDAHIMQSITTCQGFLFFFVPQQITFLRAKQAASRYRTR